MYVRASPLGSGIEFLQREGMLGSSPEDIASFLARTEGLNRTTIGDYLGEREDTSLKVVRAGAGEGHGRRSRKGKQAEKA
jgi:hypothetical protein